MALPRAIPVVLALLACAGCRERPPSERSEAEEKPVVPPSQDAPPTLSPGPHPTEPPPPPTSSGAVPPQPAPTPLPAETGGSAARVPAVARWGDVTATAHVEEKALGPHCAVRRVEPRFDGLRDPTATSRLNERLRGEGDALQKALFSDAPCDGASAALPHGFELTYELGATRNGYVALELTGSAYTGGAHPNGLLRCFVVSLRDGQLLQLSDLLTAPGRTELAAGATERLAREHGVTRLTEAGFFTDRLTLQSSTNVCLTDQGVRVQFQPYEVAPHALGYPSVEFPFDAVRQSFDRTRAQGLFDAPAK